MISNLHIQVSVRGDISYLKKAYYTPPIKIADIREDKRDRTLQLMLMSSSPGVLDGDEYFMKIELDEGSSLSLHSQSYQRLFDMQTGASQQLSLHMSNNSSFTYLPHPVVPHKSSSFTSKNMLYLASNCSLVWGEVLSCGRKLNGEEFLYSKYHTLTQIFLNGKLVVKENLLSMPAVGNIHAIGQSEGYTHQASLIYLDEKADKKTLSETILDYLSDQKSLASGISATPVRGIIVRLLGNKAEQLHTILKDIAGIIKSSQS
ncbi:MAG TPA: urease accessory protein UreD [Pedobacter sp.]|jgi:urease accessory protein